MKRGKNFTLVMITLVTLLLTSTLIFAQVAPPARINYQGVVRDSSGNPLNGLVPMTFNFYDAASAGTLLWEEIYDTDGDYPPNVTVTGGLFTMALGDPAHRNSGSEMIFTNIFANHTDVYLAVKVAADAEMTPRIKVVSAPFAENCDTLDGKHATSFLDASASGNFLNTSSTTQTKAAKLTLSSTVDYGIDASGPTAGGYFHDSNNSGYALAGIGDAGIAANGNSVGGFFRDNDSSGVAYLGYGDEGIEAYGNDAGGVFMDINSSGYAYVGYGDYGIDARGNTAGGYFKDSDGSGLAYVGYGDTGINSSGTSMGGQFHDLDSSGQAYLAWGDYGILAQGNSAGGEFQDTNSSGHTLVAFGDRGIHATGSAMGGEFQDADNSGYAYVGVFDTGIEARGNFSGGYFKDIDNSGYANVGYGDYGIDARGNTGGGIFYDLNATGYAVIGSGDSGLSAWGNYAGGTFDDSNSSSYAYVSNDTYKIFGSGTVSFVQNHPTEKDKVIVYACPEGDEVATYTRGTAKLVNGEARVKLGETFHWVTNPDIGLTAHLTAHGKAVPLAVKSLSTTELVVVGTDDVAFDYLVYGLRIGFEESSIVQEKQQESYIPSFRNHRDRYAKYPQLRSFNAFERFKGMESSIRGVSESSIDLSRAAALKASIHEYDPATDPPVDKLFGYSPDPKTSEQSQPESPSAVSTPASSTIVSQTTSRTEQVAKDTASSNAAVTTVLGFKPEPPCFPVSETIEAGDVVVMDVSVKGFVISCKTPSDPMVLGIATGPGNEKVPVATYGIVPCKIDSSYGPIHEGDLLVSSPTPGHAMRSENPKQGTVIGKALESLEIGTGTIKVLVMLR
jgi:hypothetical protein